MIVGSLLLILVAVAFLVGGVLASSDTLVVACIVVTAVAAVVLVIGVRQSAAAEVDEIDEDDETTDVSQLHSVPRGRGQRYGETRRSASQSRGESDSVYGRGAQRSATMVEEPASRGTIPAQGSADRYADESETERFVAGRYQRLEEAPYEESRYEGNGFDDNRLDDSRFDDSRFESTSYESDRYDADAAGARADTAQSVAVAEIDDEPEDEPSVQIVSPSMAARVAGLITDVLVVDGRPRYHVAGCVHLMGRESEPLPVNEAIELGFTPCGMCEPDSRLLAEARRV
jgi:hypothetical protein